MHKSELNHHLTERHTILYIKFPSCVLSCKDSLKCNQIKSGVWLSVSWFGQVDCHLARVNSSITLLSDTPFVALHFPPCCVVAFTILSVFQNKKNVLIKWRWSRKIRVTILLSWQSSGIENVSQWCNFHGICALPVCAWACINKQCCSVLKYAIGIGQANQNNEQHRHVGDKWWREGCKWRIGMRMLDVYLCSLDQLCVC